MRGKTCLRVVAALLAPIAGFAAIVGTASARSPHAEYTTLKASVPTEVSSNWGGYVVTSPDATTPISFTNVTGTWKQAAAKCGGSDADSQSAFWVGLGGYAENSAALEQIGTSADCRPTGPPSYYAWYELVPDPPISFAIAIEPGDMITSSVHVSGTQVTMEVRDLTQGTIAAQRAKAPALDLSSAEWIVEAPSSCDGSSCDMVPLVNFGSVVISKVATVGNGHSGTLSDPAWSTIPLQLVPNSEQQFFGGVDEGVVTYNSTAGTCQPTGLTAAGRSFSLSWAAIAAGC
jgi:Peptidase A4 family